MKFSEFKELVIARAEAMGITEYELYYQAAESTSVSAYQQEINQFAGNVEGGGCFRCIVDGEALLERFWSLGYIGKQKISKCLIIHSNYLVFFCILARL